MGEEDSFLLFLLLGNPGPSEAFEPYKLFDERLARLIEIESIKRSKELYSHKSE